MLEGGGVLNHLPRHVGIIMDGNGRWAAARGDGRSDGHRQGAEAVRRTVKERLAQDDVIGAATLLEERLHETDEALALLLGGWPTSRQAGGCVSAAFQMLGRLGRHDVALEQLHVLLRLAVLLLEEPFPVIFIPDFLRFLVVSHGA